MTTTPDFRALCAKLVKKLDELNCNFDIPSQSALIECANDALATPLGPPKNCWLDDEDDLWPSPCVFDDPSEMISNCAFAETVKCKTNCKYYRVVAPSPEPPTVMEILDLSGEIEEAGLGQIDLVRAALERWGRA